MTHEAFIALDHVHDLILEELLHKLIVRKKFFVFLIIFEKPVDVNIYGFFLWMLESNITHHQFFHSLAWEK
jgi:hypothetical protein